MAARTVNYLSFAYALLAVTGFTLAPSHVDRLAPALRHAAYAIDSPTTYAAWSGTGPPARSTCSRCTPQTTPR